MNIIRHGLVAGMATGAALALSLSACSTGGSNAADPAKADSTTTSQSDTDPSSALDKAFAAALAANGWKVVKFSTTCVETRDYKGWTAICAAEMSDVPMCVQSWLVLSDENATITRFALAAHGKQFGPINPKAGSIRPPACEDE